MEAKEARKLAMAKLKAGQSKRAIYAELVSKMDFKEDLVNFLASMPELEQMKRARWKNLVLVLLLYYVLAMQLVGIIVFLKTASLPQITLSGMTNIGFTIALILAIIEINRCCWNGYIYTQLASGWILYSVIASGKLLSVKIAVILPVMAMGLLAFFTARDTFPYRRRYRFDKEQYEKEYLQSENQMNPD